MGSADPSSTWCNVIQHELGSTFDLGSAEPRSWTTLLQSGLSQYTGWVLSLSASPGGTGEHATARKSAKYSSLPPSHIFQPLALETLGLINSTKISFPRAWSHNDRCLGRLSWNHILISASLLGSPALQFGGLQKNLYSSYLMGLVPLQQLGFCF